MLTKAEGSDLRQTILKKLQLHTPDKKSSANKVLAAFDWFRAPFLSCPLLCGGLIPRRRFGFFDEKSVVPRKGTLLDSLCELLQVSLQYARERGVFSPDARQERLSFAHGERDMVLLAHKFQIVWPDYKETRTCASSPPPLSFPGCFSRQMYSTSAQRDAHRVWREGGLHCHGEDRGSAGGGRGAADHQRHDTRRLDAIHGPVCDTNARQAA
jgi:hypothetical protein